MSGPGGRMMPVQRVDCPKTVSEAIYLRAYTVYKKCYGAQEAMITGTCRGGFGVGELIAFLYAASFPEAEWDDRVEEALAGIVREPLR